MKQLKKRNNDNWSLQVLGCLKCVKTISLRKMPFTTEFVAVDLHRAFGTLPGKSLVDDHKMLWRRVHSLSCVTG